MSKNVLMITKGAYPYLSANSEVVYRLARVLRDVYSCNITLLFGDWDKDIQEYQNPEKFNTVFIHTLQEYRKITMYTSHKWKRLLQYIVHPKCMRFHLRLRSRNHNVMSKEYQYAISKVLKTQKYDCVLCFSNPVDTLRGIYGVKTKVPFIAYKLDPWSTYCNKDRLQEWKDEQKIDTKAAAIVTSELIKKGYPEHTDKQILKKINTLEFPNVIDYSSRKSTVKWKEPDAIHCVFTGSLYRSIRNPRYVATMFDMLYQYNIRLHIVGFEYGNTGLLESLPKSVICHGKVSSDEAMEFMMSADILVNIGNSVLNMLPSKILTYISLGKPILNFIKQPECPTVPYMEKYPLALNILETESIVEEDVFRVREFIINNKDKHVSFEEVKDIFYNCTPEYVGGKVFDIICSVSQKSISPQC